MVTRILQIVPRLPPFTDGIGDYALRLAQQLLKDHQIDTHFLVFQQNIELENSIQGFGVTRLPSHDQAAFLSVLPDPLDGILLQYCNYPYLRNQWDAPFWFPKAIQAAIAKRCLPFVVMFHELPWLRWKQVRVLNPLQSLVSYQLGRIAEVVVTNNASFQRSLQGWLDRPIQCQPNFSTVGELEHPPPLQERKRQLVVLGSTDRDRVYRNALSEIRQIYHELRLEAIYDIGRDLNLSQRYDFRGIHLIEMGFQPAETVSQLLANSLFLALDYSHFPGNLGKSTIFAAACAHGTLPLCSRYNPSEADGLILNQHYLLLDSQVSRWTVSDLQRVADRAHQWYCAHNLEKNTQVFASFFKG